MTSTLIERVWQEPPIDDYYQVGFSEHIDNHEIVVQYRARTREDIRTESMLRSQGSPPAERDRHVVGLPDTSMRAHLPVVT